MNREKNQKAGYYRVGKRLLSIKDAADYLGIKTKTLYNMRYHRKGPDYVLIGGSPKYELEALERYIDAKRIYLSA